LKLRGGMLPRLQSAARALRERPRDTWRPATRGAVLTLEVLASCVRKLRRDRADQMAAALAFQTLFSLLPLLVLTLLVLHSVRGMQDAEAHLRNLIVEFLIPESLVELEPDLVGPPDPFAPATVEEFDDARVVLRRRLDAVLAQLSQVSFAGIGVVGFLVFLYGATSLMRDVENSYNLLCQADAARTWSRLPLYFSLITLGPVALVSAQLMQRRLLHVLESWLAAGSRPRWPGARR
jgi:membrane protein